MLGRGETSRAFFTHPAKPSWDILVSVEADGVPQQADSAALL